MVCSASDLLPPSSSLLLSSLELSDTKKSMILEYEPASEQLHISVKELSLNFVLRLDSAASMVPLEARKVSILHVGFFFYWSRGHLVTTHQYTGGS